MLRLAVRVARADAEVVLAELLELAPSGVEEIEIGDTVIEYAVYGPPGELPELPALKAVAGSALVEISTTEIADDWSERWRAFHRPLVLAGRLTVRPPWEPAAETALDVVIDPGQAFGTGAHATTRLCLELLLESEPGSFADVGCGSGVLAIAAARLGFTPVLALDYDSLAVTATVHNAAVNGVGLQAAGLDLRTDQVPVCDLWAANVLAGPLRAWAASQRKVADHVILSGLLATEASAVAAAFSRHGLRETERRERGEWAAVRLRR
ncbi:MAG: 50S ribosomal protein L11 methyltransferase [Actinomycetota bacterium]|nr:50S ribosomal protein L11 methyltransferase [Actinomycetota bacterium]